jgi:hypothetical protein
LQLWVVHIRQQICLREYRTGNARRKDGEHDQTGQKSPFQNAHRNPRSIKALNIYEARALRTYKRDLNIKTGENNRSGRGGFSLTAGIANRNNGTTYDAVLI